MVNLLVYSWHFLRVKCPSGNKSHKTGVSPEAAAESQDRMFFYWVTYQPLGRHLGLFGWGRDDPKCVCRVIRKNPGLLPGSLPEETGEIRQNALHKCGVLETQFQIKQEVLCSYISSAWNTGWREMSWRWTKTKSIHLSCLFSYFTSSWTPFCLLFLLLECKDLEFSVLSVFVSQLPRVIPGLFMSSINIYWMDEQYWKITLWTEETWQKSGKFSPGHVQTPWDFYLMFIELGIILST